MFENVNTTVKLNLTHNISSNKMLDIRFDLGQTVFSMKQQIEKRYGTNPETCELVLQDSNGNNIASLQNDKFLGFYSPQNGYWINILDLNQNSVLKGIEDVNAVEKYKISDEDYDKLPESFRKFKQKIIQGQNSGEQQQMPPVWDENYQKELADQMQIGNRCRIIEIGHRGEIKYIGKVSNKGQGYFVGIKLDLPYGNCDGKHISVQYFECLDKYGIILRPDKIEVGDFPNEDIIEDEQDEI